MISCSPMKKIRYIATVLLLLFLSPVFSGAISGAEKVILYPEDTIRLQLKDTVKSTVNNTKSVDNVPSADSVLDQQRIFKGEELIRGERLFFYGVIAMPLHTNRNDAQHVAPGRPKATEQNPKYSIVDLQPRARILSFENAQL